jgi:hypothetical protein
LGSLSTHPRRVRLEPSPDRHSLKAKQLEAGFRAVL